MIDLHKLFSFTLIYSVFRDSSNIILAISCQRWQYTVKHSNTYSFNNNEKWSTMQGNWLCFLSTSEEIHHVK